MKGLDLSKFKKVSSDKDATTLKHAQGHTLRIAHSGLSPKMKEELAKLPVHKASGGSVQRMADGGDAMPNPQPGPSSDDSSASGTPSGVNININAQPTPQPSGPTGPQSIPVPAQYTPGVSNPGPVATTGNNPNNPSPSAAQPAPQQPPQDAQPQDMDDNSPADAGGTPDQVSPDNSAQPDASGQSITSPEDLKQGIKQNYAAEDAAWQQDLANQHITPETYGSLFAKKDTLGKIGSVFGMILSGAGSGLSHQPNALLGLMQKQIDNDLQAQTQSKGNAQNFLRLNQQNQLQTAQIAQMVKQGKLTDAQASAALQDIQIKSQTLAHNQAMRAAYHALVVQADKYPAGSPQRAQATQALGAMYPMINEAITNKSDQAAALSAYSALLGGGSGQSGDQGAQDSGSIDYNRMNALERQGQQKIPGGMTPEDTAAATKEAGTVEESRSIRNDYMDSFNKVKDLTLAGKISPNQRAAYVNALAAKLAKQSAGRYNLEEAKSLVDGMFPSASDGPGTADVKLKKGMDYFNTTEAETPTLNRFHLKKAMSNTQGKPATPAIPEGATGTYNGKPVTRVNGKWKYN